MNTVTIGRAPASLAEKVEFLRSPGAYPHRPAAVRAIETHMSWLFLTGSLAYKLKKPVRFPFLDFTTLGRRRHYCAAELSLNRRLAPDVYRRLVPLRRSPDGRLSLGGGGEVAEWVVEMAQLAEDRMLDNAIRAGTVTAEEITAVAEMLGRFYLRERPHRRDGYDYLKHIYFESDVNRKLLTRADCGLPAETTTALLDRVEGLLRRYAPDVVERIKSGRIVEGHGDLRPAHVFLGPPPQIIDCLEFDRSMRLLDPYDEVNYLGLECERAGAGWVRALALDVIERHLGHRPQAGLLAFYGAFRMVLRARICIAHLLDPQPMTPAVWPERAARYLEMAGRECLKAGG
jgi:aminoglycoside phosphotransferase family enzyme